MTKRKASAFSQFSYFLKEGINGIFIHGFMSCAAVTAISACLLITATFMLLVLNIDVQIDKLQSNNEIVVYVDESFSREQAQALGEKISAIENVAKATFVTKEEFFEDYIASLGEYAYIMSDLREDNPLRDSYRVEMNDIALHKKTLSDLSEVIGIADSDSDIEVSERLVKIRAVVRTVSLLMLILLGAVSLFIISNTVKLALFARREEIGIMKYVGATNAFIRAPFIVEGIILGVAASVFVFAAQWLVYNYLMTRLAAGTGIFEMVAFETFRYKLALELLAAGLLLGIGGSTITITRFMRV